MLGLQWNAKSAVANVNVMLSYVSEFIKYYKRVQMSFKGCHCCLLEKLRYNGRHLGVNR